MTEAQSGDKSHDQSFYKSDQSLLYGIDINAPIASTHPQSCDYYSGHFTAASEAARANGNISTAEVFSLLGIVTSFHSNFDEPSNPFVPFMQFQGRRSLQPSDLSPTDAEVVRLLAPRAINHALRARLFDVAWERKRDYKDCTQAASAYLASAKLLDTAEEWPSAVSAFHRAIYLAGRIGRNKTLFTEVVTEMQQAINQAAESNDPARCDPYLKLMLKFGIGNPGEQAALAQKLAARANEEGDLFEYQRFLTLEADFYKRTKNAKAERLIRIEIAEAEVAQAEQRTAGAGKSFLAAASILGRAIEGLRQAQADGNRILELRQRLNEYQQHSLSEFTTFTGEADITKEVKTAEDYVANHDFETALFRFALGYPLTDLREVRERTLKTIKDFSFKHLFETSVMDEKGRTKLKRPALLEKAGEEFEKELEAEMFHICATTYWPLRVNSYISPAKEQIFMDHYPTHDKLEFLVQQNQFIPPGHERIFLRGIHAGFSGDFMTASHLLVPQIENSLRHLLELRGVDTSNLMTDGTQPVKILGGIFGLPETKEILGEDLLFELRGCLNEKTGFDFRNRVAHGFVSEADCYGPAAKTIWWLVLRICLTPVFHRLPQETKGKLAKEHPK